MNFLFWRASRDSFVICVTEFITFLHFKLENSQGLKNLTPPKLIGLRGVFGMHPNFICGRHYHDSLIYVS